jgi:hypothetical protein
MPDLDTDDLAALIKACDADLGDPTLWFTPDGYPDSLALCIVDSIYSTGARYSSVVNVVVRYREYRTNQGGNPETDSADELAATISELSGPDPWATRIGNRRPTSTAAGAPLKAETIATITEVPGSWSPHHRRSAGSRGHRGYPQGGRTSVAWHCRAALRHHLGLRTHACPDPRRQGRPNGYQVRDPRHRLPTRIRVTRTSRAARLSSRRI